jgi:hypothetical protein
MLPLFPRDFVTMRSGRGFHKSCNDVYVKAYRDEMMTIKRGTVPKYTKTEIERMLLPHLWELSKSLWLYGLALKILVVILSLHQMLQMSCLTMLLTFQSPGRN